MGLDIAEVMMDLEDHFNIRIDESGGLPIRGDISSICDLVSKCIDTQINQNQLCLNDDPNYIYKGAELTELCNKYNLHLPRGLFKRTSYTSCEIHERLMGRLDVKFGPHYIKYKVKEIVKYRAGINYWPDDDDHIISEIGL